MSDVKHEPVTPEELEGYNAFLKLKMIQNSINGTGELQADDISLIFESLFADFEKTKEKFLSFDARRCTSRYGPLV